MNRKSNRRQFLKHTALASVGFWVGSRSSWAAPRSPNEKLNIAGIGVGGQGSYDLDQVATENIVALCDVDEGRAGGTFERFSKARRFQDFRRMLEAMDKEIDAVTVSTPDHMHAPAALLAMRMGKHVYCQKPLARTVYECRRLADVAAQTKLVTQMGTQGHSEPEAQRAVDVLQAGVIGSIREVHVWTDRPLNWWPQAIDRPTDRPEVPHSLNWDLWLGVAPERPYHPAYLPFVWRGWWDFGTGALGDIACHMCDIPFRALDLRDPTHVSAERSDVHVETGPAWSIITYQFPATDKRPAVKLVWYDGGKKPPAELGPGKDLAANGCVFVGEKGRFYFTSSFGEHAQLLPAEQFRDYKLPELKVDEPLSRGLRHYRRWVRACKTGEPTGSNFGFAARMAEAMLLGVVCLRANKPIEWDAKQMKVTNVPEANAFVRPEYRKGWVL